MILPSWLLIVGVAANGSQGAIEMIDIVTEELRRIMSVTGCRNLSVIDDRVLIKRDLI